MVPAQLDLSKVAFDGAGALDITSTAGSDTTQANALMVKGSARPDSYFVQTDVKPVGAADFAGLLTTDYQEAGLFVGDGSANYVKIVAQHGSGGTRIEFFKSGSAAGRHTAVNFTGVSCIRFTMQVNTVAKVVTGKYALTCTNGAPQTNMGYFPLANVGPGSTDAMGGGILTTNIGNLTPITAAFSNFTVGADPTTDIAAPILKDRSPAAGVTGVPTTTAIQATFDSKMDLSSITNATFTVAKTAGGPPVATGVPQGTNAPANPVFTITPTAPLDPGTQYTVSLNGFKDVNGNPLPATTWSFTTAGVPAPPSGGGTTPPPAGGGTTTPAAGGGSAAAASGGTVTVLPPPLISVASAKQPLKASFSLSTKRVKAGKNGLITLRFNQVPDASQVVVQKRNGKKYAAIFRTKASRATTLVRFPVGKKLGTFTFRASYVDSGAVKYTAPFNLTIVK